ncbi:MAG: PTS galactitol transporter subunit IIC [Spirochaetes bacterium]|nr:PTS galactitol transporter subunit IIC [Spirochaetota bacterium]
METLQRVIDFLFSFKAYVMLPAIMLVVALAIRMKVGQSLLSALRLGVGFAGIFIAFDFFVQQIAPAVTAVVRTRGLDFPVLDVGWPPLAAITWASPIAPLTILLVLALNLAMLALNLTRTVNIDIWNYWHFALIGALVQAASGSLLLGLAATALIAVYGILAADWNAPLVEKECGLSGISITTLSVNGLLPYGVAANSMIDRIPGLRRISLSPRDTGSRFGILIEPMMIGVAVGAFFGILAGYEVKKILELAINVAAVMFILPHCGGLIGKGMEPVSLQLKGLIQKRFPKKTVLYIGMDAGVIMQNSAVIVTGLLLMPISIGIAFILPGNKTLPLGDLANLISVMSVIVLATRGNVFRAVLIGIPIIVAYLLISTHFAPFYTTLAARAGAESVRAYAGEITAFTDGGNPVRFWFFYLFRGNVWALAAIPPALGLMYLCWRNYRRLLKEGTK